MLWQKIRGFHSSNFNNLKNIQKQNKNQKPHFLGPCYENVENQRKQKQNLNICKNYHYFILEFKLRLQTKGRVRFHIDYFQISAGLRIMTIKQYM